MKPRRWLARLIICALAALLALLTAELCVRVFWGAETIVFPRYHTAADYGLVRLRRLRPSTTFQHTSADGSWLFTTNAQGFRDTRDWHHERTPGLLRILVLGDSHTQGFECRQDRTYSVALERRLADAGTPAEVLNCGISGMGTAEQLAFLEHEGIRYRPDVVVLGWFANDPDDNLKSGLFALRDGQLVVEKTEHLPGVAILDALNRWAALRWLSEHSHFYSLLFNRVWEWRKGLLSQRANTAAEYTGAPPATAATPQVDLAAALITRMQNVCATAGARFLIVDIPCRIDAATSDSSIPPALREHFRTHCDALLPSDAMRAAHTTSELFVAHGQHHISEHTHALIADSLAAAIRSQKAPPDAPIRARQ